MLMYAVRLKGKYFRKDGFKQLFHNKSLWVDTIEEAKIFNTEGTAKSAITTIFKKHCEDGVPPTLVEFTLTETAEIDQTKRLKSILIAENKKLHKNNIITFKDAIEASNRRIEQDKLELEYNQKQLAKLTGE